MPDTVIRVENLSKKYVLGHQEQEKYTTLRDAIANRARSLTPKIQSPPFNKSISKSAHEEFWALKDVSFEIKQGDRVGIIGRNGAGKSTLLKILSRITEPTSGCITIKGRVASLLEVGTGFHPELTGRENIYLNGAVLGMSKAEINKKFDEIVAFAEVEKFLDTPVKRYSSGMYVRLAFAVAAHLEPEILIVDEVLAVGDAMFQKKCIGKMSEVSEKEGRTVLFISHNIGVMRDLCSRAILLKEGNLIKDATFEETAQEYLASATVFNGFWKRQVNSSEQKNIFFLEIGVKTNSGEQNGHISSIEPFDINIIFKVEKTISNAQIHMRITNQEGIPVLTTANTDFDNKQQHMERGINQYRINMPGAFFKPGIYSLIIAFIIPKLGIIDVVDSKVMFSIDDMGSHDTILNDNRLGVVTPIIKWEKTELAFQ